MKTGNRKGFGLVNIVFWVLLLYIIAALIWWFISLEKQNDIIYKLKAEHAISTGMNNTAGIESEHKRNSRKYFAEGVTFLLLIIFGATYIYRLVRRQFRMQQQQQNFMMAVTHELKTPITVARLNLETVQKHSLPEDRQKKLMHATLEETLRLDTLINNILISSQLDGNEYRALKEKTNLSVLVEKVVKDFRSRYPERKIFTDIDPEVFVTGDSLLLQLLVSNLVENANKYSPRDRPVKCILANRNGKTIMQVIDEGSGISEAEKKNIFRKFYRIGNEETRRSKGTGLGLFLCKKITNTHNATIQVRDNLPNGSSFTVCFK